MVDIHIADHCICLCGLVGIDLHGQQHSRGTETYHAFSTSVGSYSGVRNGCPPIHKSILRSAIPKHNVLWEFLAWLYTSQQCEWEEQGTQVHHAQVQV